MRYDAVLGDLGTCTHHPQWSKGQVREDTEKSFMDVRLVEGVYGFESHCSNDFRELMPLVCEGRINRVLR